MQSTQVSEFTKAVLQRKTAGQKASVAVVWGSINFAILAIILSDLHIGGWSGYHVLAWWIAVVISGICIINILLHLKSYIAPSFSLSPLTVNNEQKKLMSINENECCFKSSVPEKKPSTPASNKKISFSALFESTMRQTQGGLPPSVSCTPTVSSTPLNNSAGSWAPSPGSPSLNYGITPFNMSPGSWAPTPITSSSSPWMNTPINTSPGSWAPTPNARSNESWGSCVAMSPSVSPLNFSLGSSISSAGGNDTSLISNTSVGSVHANSWSYHGNQSSIMDSSYGLLMNSMNSSSYNRSNGSNIPSANSKSIPSISKIVCINTREDLDKYLQDYHDQEKKKQTLSHNEINGSVNSSLWMYGGSSPHQGDYGHMLRNNVYQVATKDIGEEPNSSNSKSEDVTASSSLSSSVSVIWTKRNVTPKQLFQYEENLRIWLSSNILVPLVKAIDKTNEALAAVAPELQIGTVGVDKLKKASQNICGVKQLANLLPFLDLTLHQDYLVHRLRQLSHGGAISAFKWNGGSSFNGKKWWDEYPTDTFILLHLFSMYMDTQLPPDPTQPDGRVFSSTHVVKTPEKPVKPTQHCILYLTQVSPPHLKVIIQDEECEVGGGHKNLMHSLLLFCHHVTHQQHSRMSGVNLSLSGINLAWVVDAL